MKFRLLIVPVILVIFALSGCSSAKNKLPKYQFMKVKNQEIQDFEADEVRSLIMNLDTVQHQFHNKPDYVIYAHTSESKYDMFCIYLDKELIYQGDVFKAMFDDLTDRKSECLQMDEETLEFLQNLESSY